MNQERTQPSQKQPIWLCYDGSGVKTLDGFSTFFFVLAVMSLVTCAGALIWLAVEADSYREEIDAPLALLTSFAYSSLTCFCFGAICRGLSSIAKTSLMQRAILKKDYDFKEPGREA